jgi:hypothetical protein
LEHSTRIEVARTLWSRDHAGLVVVVPFWRNDPASVGQTPRRNGSDDQNCHYVDMSPDSRASTANLHSCTLSQFKSRNGQRQSLYGEVEATIKSGLLAFRKRGI